MQDTSELMVARVQPLRDYHLRLRAHSLPILAVLGASRLLRGQPKGLAFVRSLPIIRIWEKFALWMKGPQPPRRYHIKPICGLVQTAPTRLLARRFSPLHRAWLLAAYYLLWVLLFVLGLHKYTSIGPIGRYGPPVRLSCISRLW